jgi:hypothetical protein
VARPVEKSLNAAYDAAQAMALSTVVNSAAIDSFLAYARSEAEAIIRSKALLAASLLKQKRVLSPRSIHQSILLPRDIRDASPRN